MLLILRSQQTTVCPIWTTAKTRQIVERVGLSDLQRRDPIELWDSGADQFDGIFHGIAGARNLPRSLRLCGSDSGFDSASCSRNLHSRCAVSWKAINPASAINSWRHTGPSYAAAPPHSAVTSTCVAAAASKPASPITHAARAAIPSSRRMHTNAGSRHGRNLLPTN
jgi:hypothetical protein